MQYNHANTGINTWSGINNYNTTGYNSSSCGAEGAPKKSPKTITELFACTTKEEFNACFDELIMEKLNG